MRAEILSGPPVGRKVAAAGLFLGVVLVAGQATGADAIDSDTDEILRSVSAYLGGLSTFSVSADIDTEVIDRQGQKIQLSSSSTIVVERPNRLRVARKGVLADVELTFDGKHLTVFGKKLNAYFQREVSGTIDDVIEVVHTEIGLDAPAADLIYADPYPRLASGVTGSAYLGTAYVNGVETHHLAFREDETDWQLWVRTGDQPLPMKYIITTKWMTGAPQYSVRFRDWDVKPKGEADQFSFSAPEGATRLTAIAVNHTGEPILEGEQQ